MFLGLTLTEKRLEKDMPRRIHLRNVFALLRGRLGRRARAPEEKFLSDDVGSEGNKRWRPVSPAHATAKILVDSGVITSEQLERALNRQRELQEKGKEKGLGILLAEMGYMTSQAYLEALSQYFGLPVISLWDFIPSPSLQSLVAGAYARRHRLIILGDSETEIRLALAEPDPLILKELIKIFGPKKKVNFYLANPFEVENCFRKYLDPFSMNFYR